MVVFSPNWTIFPATTDDHTSLKTTFPFSCCYLFPGSSNEFVSRLFRATISGTGSLSVHQERYGKECHINIFAMSHQTNVSPNFCAKGWNTLKMFNQVWASLAGRFYNVTELGAYHTVYFTFSWPMYCDCNFLFLKNWHLNNVDAVLKSLHRFASRSAVPEILMQMKKNKK